MNFSLWLDVGWFGFDEGFGSASVYLSTTRHDHRVWFLKSWMLFDIIFARWWLFLGILYIYGDDMEFLDIHGWGTRSLILVPKSRGESTCCSTSCIHLVWDALNDDNDDIIRFHTLYIYKDLFVSSNYTVLCGAVS